MSPVDDLKNNLGPSLDDIDIEQAFPQPSNPNRIFPPAGSIEPAPKPSSLGQQVAAKIVQNDTSPDADMRFMVNAARELLNQIDDKRAKLEAYREVQIENAIAAAKADQDRRATSIENYEQQINMLRQAMAQADTDHRANLASINASVDKQVTALNTMEGWHRGVVESSATNITPAPKKPDVIDEDKTVPH
jgi:hypothetical protein